jgi:hypothetical protein
MSKPWERQNLRLDEIIKLEDFEIISNVHQRTEVGGCPAIIVNKNKFQVQNIANSLDQITWGSKQSFLTPKNVTNDSKIQKIACWSFYSKPGSRKKYFLLDHIADAYFALAGDSNDLKLDSILSLDSRFVQIVKKWTRMNPPALLDPIITSLANFYQEPLCLEPLDADPDKNGVKSDHRIVVSRPIKAINNKCVRSTRKVKVRPFPESVIKKDERMVHWPDMKAGVHSWISSWESPNIPANIGSKTRGNISRERKESE